MSTALAAAQTAQLTHLDAETMQHLVAGGDCSRLSPAQKLAYYQARCEAAGLDPRAQPFAFMRLNGKEVLYAQKAATDQLAAKHGLRTTIVSQTTEEGIRVVTVRAEAKDGRVTEEIGALPVKGLVGEALSNALMKCVTKAKRRAVLSLCGLGMLDETEVESIPQAQPVEAKPAAVVEVVSAMSGQTPPQDVPTKDTLWEKCRIEFGDKAAENWRAGAIKVFGKKVPAPERWTTQNLLDVEFALFGPHDTEPPPSPGDVPF